MFSRDVFVPNGDSRQDTAIVLVGTASEYGIDQRSIKAVADGFHITNELAALVYDEPEPKARKKASTKTSGNRAAKNSPTEKE